MMRRVVVALLAGRGKKVQTGATSSSCAELSALLPEPVQLGNGTGGRSISSWLRLAKVRRLW